jgi:hypothetical protein
VLFGLPLLTLFYVDGGAAASYPDLRLGGETDDGAGGVRRQLHIDDQYAHRRAAESRPSVLIFPAIVDAGRSSISRLDDVSAVARLLPASGPQLFDATDMPQHLEILRSLVTQSTAFRLDAGRDLHERPAILQELMPAWVAW